MDRSIAMETVMRKLYWQDWLTAVVGAWLIVSPWILKFPTLEGMLATFAILNFALAGLATLAFAAAALASYRLWEEWADIVIGLWLVVSPWVLQLTVSPLAKWNAVITGLIIIVTAAWTLAEGRQPEHA
jgi:phosphoglycerol transferase MdoB-like AlkP superfamily enzyme